MLFFWQNHMLVFTLTLLVIHVALHCGCQVTYRMLVVRSIHMFFFSEQKMSLTFGYPEWKCHILALQCCPFVNSRCLIARGKWAVTWGLFFGNNGSLDIYRTGPVTLVVLIIANILERALSHFCLAQSIFSMWWNKICLNQLQTFMSETCRSDLRWGWCLLFFLCYWTIWCALMCILMCISYYFAF